MPEEIGMPRLSDTMSEGTIARWHKQPGDVLHRGEPLAQIETDKALMEYESFVEGTLGAILVKEGETAPLGAPIAVVFAPGETVELGVTAAAGTSTAPPARPAVDSPALPGQSADAAVAGPDTAASANAAGAERGAKPPADAVGAGADAAPTPTDEVAPVEPGGKVRASPLARRLAGERGIDLHTLAGSGPNGRIVRADVEAAAASPARPISAGDATAVARPAPAEAGPAAQPTPVAATAPASQPQTPAALPGRQATQVPFSRMQTVVARRMVESKTQVPHFYATMAIDMAAAIRFRAESNAYLGKEAGFSVNDLFVKAAALTLRKHPALNASFHDGGFTYHADVNIGIAVALPGGLVVPVIRDADHKSLPRIGAEARALAEKARRGGLALADYEGGTFTISNLGMYGVESFSAIVNPPQAAILAIGGVAEEPVVVDGQLQVGQRCRLTISCDHRVVYGADAAEFLRDLKQVLERPLSLVY